MTQCLSLSLSLSLICSVNSSAGDDPSAERSVLVSLSPSSSISTTGAGSLAMPRAPLRRGSSSVCASARTSALATISTACSSVKPSIVFTKSEISMTDRSSKLKIPCSTSRSASSVSTISIFSNALTAFSITSSSSSAVMISMSQPTSFEASRTFWPRRPMASES